MFPQEKHLGILWLTKQWCVLKMFLHPKVEREPGTVGSGIAEIFKEWKLGYLVKISSKLHSFTLFWVKFFWIACFHHPTGSVDTVLLPIPPRKHDLKHKFVFYTLNIRTREKGQTTIRIPWSPVALPHISTLHFSRCWAMRSRTSFAMGPLPAGNTVGQYQGLVFWTHF